MLNLFLKFLPSVVVPIILTGLTTILLGNILSVEEFGQYNIIIVTISLVTGSLFVLVNGPIVRELPIYLNKKKDENLFLSSYFVLALCLICVVSLVIFFLDIENSFIITFGIYSLALYNFSINVIRLSSKISMFTFVKVLAPTLTFVSYVIFKKIDYVEATLLLYSPMFLIVFIFQIILLNRKVISFFKVKIHILREGFKYSWILVFTNLINGLLASLDRFMLDFLTTKTEVGIYSFNYRLTEIIFVNLSMIFIMIYYPKLIILYENEVKEKSEKLLSSILTYYCLISIPLLGLMIINSNFILKLLFEQYSSYGKIFSLSAVSAFIFSLTFFTNKLFELPKKTYHLGWISLIALILNVLLNSILIPLFKSTGAIYASILSYSILLLFSVKLGKKEFNLIINRKHISLYLIYTLVISLFIYNGIRLESLLMNLFLNNIVFLIFTIPTSLYLFNKTKSMKGS